jgi:SMODS-associated and fused to various effectors sensor domain
MTQAVSVRRDGDTFQARLFWLRASQMLNLHSSIARVGFECGPKSFDDVWVEHIANMAPLDHEGLPVLREHTQCKWHVSPGQYGYKDLIDPAFINAESHSLLQRARQAQLQYAPDGTGSRFKLYTNWRVDCNDPLSDLIHKRSHSLRLDRMWEGKTSRSFRGQLRAGWMEHLSIPEEALRVLARTLAFAETTDSLDDMRERLNEQFQFLGLRSIPSSESTFIYDEVVFRWLAQGRTIFDRATFHEACRNEGLLEPGRPVPLIFGVKSFEHPTDALEDRCVRVLNLLPAFYDRQIRPESDWQTDIYPRLKSFLLESAKPHEHLRLALDAHITLAVAAGTVLNLKSGRSLEIEQRTNGRRVWAPDDQERAADWSGWESKVSELAAQGEDLVVAVGLTNNPLPMVSAYLARAKLPAHLQLFVTPTSGPGAASVRCGRHAVELAEQLVEQVAGLRSSGSFSGAVHLFLAVPNGFSFFLGQRLARMGHVVLYEFDFEGLNGASYSPSLRLPVPAAPDGKD